MSVLLKNAALLDARRLIEMQDVLVENGRITAVGKNLGPADREIDLTGYTLLPSFIDAHVHVAVDDHAFKDSAIRAWAYNGVSTVRELGMLSQLSQADYAAWIKKMNSQPETATVVAVGNYIDVAGGYGAGPNPNHPVGTLITTAGEAAEEVTVQRIVCRADLTFNLAEAFVMDFRECLDDLKNAHVLCNEEKTGSYGFTH